MTDAQSLAEYSRTRSAEAMGFLVRRYVDLVYATARRLVGDAHLAEDVTQAAFIILVKKANRIDPATLPGWLVNTTRLAARAAIKSKRTRTQYETRAAQMRSQIQAPKEEPTADELLPMLDDALAKLSDADRTAVVMRFLQGRTFVEVGEAMGSSEEAARKRVGRAVEKPRTIFLKQGLVPSVGGLMVVLAAQQSPPAAAAVLAGVTGALSTGGVGASAAIAKGAMSIMKWAQIKLVAILTLSVTAIAGLSVGVSTFGMATSLSQSTRPKAAARSLEPGAKTGVQAVVSDDSAASAKYEDGIALWMKGEKDAAVQAFIHADWKNGGFIAGDPTLGLTETQYEAKYPNDPALQKDLSDKTVALKELAREILARGDAANAGNAQMARQYYLSIKECGAYLSTRQDGLAVLKLVGQALVTKADGSLAKLR